MNARLMYVLGPLLVLLLAVAGVEWWLANMEKHWEAHVEQSDEAIKNPMLAASRLLSRHHHPVQTEETLSTVLLRPSLPSGTMILAQNTGVMTKPQVHQLLGWVARGNTLITSPIWGTPSGTSSREDDDDAAEGDREKAAKSNAQYRANADMSDQLGQHFGAQLESAAGEKEYCRNPRISPEAVAENEKRGFTYIDCVASITLPDHEYSLRLDGEGTRIAPRGTGKKMLFYDEDGKAVRAYPYGKGRVIFTARNYFDNDALPQYDHAELLLGLVDQNPDAKAVLIVKRPDVPTWYQTLWAMVPQTLFALGIGSLLLGWAAVRRFGPLLPEPDLARRSVLEHVEASSRWLWKSGKGREILLGAARAATLKILLRRVPQLHKFNEQERVAFLAEHTGLLCSDVDSALHSAAAPRPPEFTRQIQTLQRLRKHYER